MSLDGGCTECEVYTAIRECDCGCGERLCQMCLDAHEQMETKDQDSLPCTQCGVLATEFREGVCQSCHEQNQRELDEHHATLDWWHGMTDAQRERTIRNA